MTASDPQILIDFRSEVPQPDDETARRVYMRATASAAARDRGVGRLPRMRRSRLLLGIAVAALVLVPTAVAFGGKIVDLFEGTPAPPEVSAEFTILNKAADMSIQKGFTGIVGHADVSKAHGVIEIQTPDGPQDLWVAPYDAGGQCYFIDYANDSVSQSGGKPGFGGCGTPAQAYSYSEIDPEGPYYTYKHPNLLTIDGSVAIDATTVRITFHDGSTLTLPVVEHWFLASIPKPAQESDANLENVTAFDAAGNQVADWTPPH